MSTELPTRFIKLYSIMGSKIQMSNIVGREKEINIIRACTSLSRHLILEGPVGVGKTFLARSVAQKSQTPMIRIEGSPHLSEEKLVGYFDPPMVMEKGYIPDVFIEGPLVRAMTSGSILFVNEINRLPSSLQNIFLTVLDEKQLFVPKLGWKQAHDNFCVIATQNPQEFVGTRQLSEALLDRFERLIIDHQSYEEEKEIISSIPAPDSIREKALMLVRATRTHPQVRRGASIRAAQAILELYQEIQDFSLCASLALSTRVEWANQGSDPESLIAEMEKKKYNNPQEKKGS